MVTEEEKQQIILEAAEYILLRLPEVVGNLFQVTAVNHKLNTEFYGKYPEFKEYTNVVQSVIMAEEHKDPLRDYAQLQADAVPEIRRQIAVMKSLDMTGVNKNPRRDYNGAI